MLALKDAINQFIKANNLGDLYQKAHIYLAWEKVAGNYVHQNTLKLEYKDKKIFVELKSASLKHEVFMAKTEIAKAINDHLGGPFVEDIIVG